MLYKDASFIFFFFFLNFSTFCIVTTSSPQKMASTVTTLGTRCCRPWAGKRGKVLDATSRASRLPLRYGGSVCEFVFVFFPFPLFFSFLHECLLRGLRCAVVLCRHSWEQRELDSAPKAPTTTSPLQTRTKMRSARQCSLASRSWKTETSASCSAVMAGDRSLTAKQWCRCNGISELVLKLKTFHDFYTLMNIMVVPMCP